MWVFAMFKVNFIGVGVGPGDSELLTVKGIKTLKSVPVICAPKSSKDKPSLALSIVQNILNERKDDYVILEPLFPMIEDKEHWKIIGRALLNL